jgi:hypothetical protein
MNEYRNDVALRNIRYISRTMRVVDAAKRLLPYLGAIFIGLLMGIGLWAEFFLAAMP